MSIRIAIQSAAGGAWHPDARRLRAWARTAAVGVDTDGAELTLRIVGEAESRALNHRYRGKDSATNVLSFPFEDPPGLSTALLGDVVVCAPVVDREAQVFDCSTEAYWAHMVIHGVLHLRGYDHERNEDAAVMQAAESRLLTGLGFADPYLGESALSAATVSL